MLVPIEDFWLSTVVDLLGKRRQIKCFLTSWSFGDYETKSGVYSSLEIFYLGKVEELTGLGDIDFVARMHDEISMIEKVQGGKQP